MHMEQRGVNPLDTTVVASLNESEAAIMTRVAEKKVQMAVSHCLAAGGEVMVLVMGVNGCASVRDFDGCMSQ